MRLPLARSMTAARSFLLHDHRNTAWLLAGLAGRWARSGERGQRIVGRETLTAITDFGQEACSADGSRAGQAREDVLVGMRGKCRSYLDVQDPDLRVQHVQHGHQCEGDLAAGFPLQDR